jgi:hypothetical protein
VIFVDVLPKLKHLGFLGSQTETAFPNEGLTSPNPRATTPCRSIVMLVDCFKAHVLKLPGSPCISIETLPRRNFGLSQSYMIKYNHRRNFVKQKNTRENMGNSLRTFHAAENSFRSGLYAGQQFSFWLPQYMGMKRQGDSNSCLKVASAINLCLLISVITKLERRTL